MSTNKKTKKFTILSIKKKFTLKYPKFDLQDFFSKGLKSEFEIAVVNEPSMFEPLQVYCLWLPAETVCVFVLPAECQQEA